MSDSVPASEPPARGERGASYTLHINVEAPDEATAGDVMCDAATDCIGKDDRVTLGAMWVAPESPAPRSSSGGGMEERVELHAAAEILRTANAPCFAKVVERAAARFAELERQTSVRAEVITRLRRDINEEYEMRVSAESQAEAALSSLARAEEALRKIAEAGRERGFLFPGEVQQIARSALTSLRPSAASPSEAQGRGEGA